MDSVLKPYGYFKSLCKSPERLAIAISDYFRIKEQMTNPPPCPFTDTDEEEQPLVQIKKTTLYSVAGLARWLGCKSASHLKKMARDSAKLTSEARYMLDSALTYIEELYVEGALVEKFNPSVVKTMLSAHNEVHEKHIEEQRGHQQIHISWGMAAQPSILPGNEKNVQLLENTAMQIAYAKQNDLIAKSTGEIIDASGVEIF